MSISCWVWASAACCLHAPCIDLEHRHLLCFSIVLIAQLHLPAKLRGIADFAADE